MTDFAERPYLDGLPAKVRWECRRRLGFVERSEPWLDANLELIELETDSRDRICAVRFRPYVVEMIELCRRASSLWLWRAAQFEAMLHAIDHPDEPPSQPVRWS